MAGIYSQGGSAGHRYAGWLSEVEAKNFTFGGKVFNGSPSAIYVGSNLVWANWLTQATKQAIIGAFGQRDGKAVIKATNAYLNQLAASDRDKATALAGFINEDPIPYATMIYTDNEHPVPYLASNGNSWCDITTLQSSAVRSVEADVVLRLTTKSYCICGGNSGYNALAVETAADYIHFRTYQGKYYRYDTVAYNTPLTIIATDSSISVNGVDGYYYRTSGDSAQGTLKIFDGRTASGYTSGQRMVGCISRIYINNDAYKLYPVERNGVGGLYDMVGKVFWPNVGTEPFTMPATPSTP